MTTRPDPAFDTKPSNFASRKRERLAREAIEGPPPPFRARGTLRAGADAEQISGVVITRVSR